MRDDSICLRHIKDSIALVEDYLVDPEESLLRDLFYQDQRTQDAVLRRLEALSDAASQLSGTLKDRHPEVPWRQINAFRNVLAHGYTDILLNEVWQVIDKDIGTRKAAVLLELT